MKKPGNIVRTFLIIVVGLLIISNMGCSTSAQAPEKTVDSEAYSILETVLNIDENELEQKISNNETFVLELFKPNCSYCKDFESECLEASTKEPISYLRLSIDTLDVQALEKKLSIDIDAVPIVVWVQDGKADNLFPIDYPQNRRALFVEWIEDNIAYFNENGKKIHYE